MGSGEKRSRRRRRAPISVEARAKRALEELRELARGLALRQGVVPDEVEVESIVLPLRAALAAPVTDEDVAGLLASLEPRVADAIKASSAFRAGRMFCFLCDSSECSHAAPGDTRDTFCGYRPTGKPEWQSFTNLCIQRQDERVDQLFGDRPAIIAVVQSAEELKQGLLPGFGQGSTVFNVLGQVVIGLLPRNLDPGRPVDERVALTLQIVETRTGTSGRRLRLNLIGLPEAEIVATATSAGSRGPAESFRRTLRTTRDRVRSEARRVRDAEERGETPDIESRMGPLLARIRGDVERCFRPVHRRTRHAQERHEGGERPTSRAYADARTSPDERFLEDVERETIIVLGPRNRAHVFSPAGRHVTSLQLRPGEVDRKVDRRRWRPMTRADVHTFREQLGD